MLRSTNRWILSYAHEKQEEERSKASREQCPSERGKAGLLEPCARIGRWHVTIERHADLQRDELGAVACRLELEACVPEAGVPTAREQTWIVALLINAMSDLLEHTGALLVDEALAEQVVGHRALASEACCVDD